MVQFSQTSWQEYSLANVLETLRFAPMSLTMVKDPIVYYTLPKSLDAGEIVKYTVVAGFKKISWTGIIAASSENKVTVRLDKGPFRGFNATHQFSSEGNLTACNDTFSFQGFSEFTESEFANLMDKAGIVYAIAGRKAAREIILAVESKKQTQSFEALDNAATAG
ncbi:MULTISPECIES: hypothetical protein [unclassified Fibrobacter]|uniref:hypothetical protein n=1 Tax=unclassified Fibrobacter TaxID=2634177 RepID=UPI000D7A38B7|nr:MULTISPECIES: hypothetical protein [unclassified Fibrobacter]PWJ71775.1 hypothetical protein BGX12_1019 [Fibrobacter sp. UWR4]PZW73690.1 hypothetical protein C8E88_10029 [Fibrobacter sp. UWR1]